MRKRIIIALLAVVVIGAVAFFVSQPKKGSVEWHKREYLAAKEDVDGFTWFSGTGVYKVYCKIRGRHPIRPVRARNPIEYRAHLQRMGAAQRALLDLGYLSERRFAVSNRPSLEVRMRVSAKALGEFPQERVQFTWFGRAGDDPNPDTNQLVVVALANDIAKYEEFVRKADVP